MALPAVLAGAAIAGPVVGGIIGNIASAADRARAQRAAEEAFAEIDALGLPPDLSKAVILEKFKRAGVYTPELEQEISAGLSKAEAIKEDPALREAQMGALNLIKERASTGYNAEDRAAANKLKNQVGIAHQGRLGSILQERAGRGLLGGGDELAAMLSSSQSALQDESASADRLAAEASSRALQAALQSGQLGSQIREQDFGVAKAKADAADRFKLFDTENSVARQRANVGAQNQAELYNLSEDQRIQDANSQMQNAELYRQREAQRTYWQDQAQRAGMRANAKQGQAANYNAAADSTAKMWQGVGSGIGSGAGAGLNYMASQKPTAAPAGQVDQQVGTQVVADDNDPRYAKYGDKRSSY